MKHDRRQFLGTTLAAAPLFIPSRAFGANDRLAFGLIGAGGRGRYLQETFLKLGAECVAIAEVYDLNMASAAKNAPDAKQYIDYHDLLKQPGLDAVVIASPDHQHAPMLFAALDARKDVVPGKADVALHRAEPADDQARCAPPKQIVQIGMQRRSAPAVIKAKEVIDTGILGTHHHGEADVELERIARSKQLLPCPANWTGTASWAAPGSATWSRCASAVGATSGTTRAAT